MWGMSVSGGGLCGTLGFLFASGFSPHTGHQLAFTRERKDSVEMIKLINRSNFFLPVFLLKMFFFFFLISIFPKVLQKWLS